MHSTLLTTTTLALLSISSFATAEHGNMPKQNHASFARVRRGGPTIHLVGDETVAKWAGDSVPLLPVIQNTEATSATSSWNLLDSINAGLGAPIGKPTSTSSSSSSASSFSASSSDADTTASPDATPKVRAALISAKSDAEAESSASPEVVSSSSKAEASSASSPSSKAEASSASSPSSKAAVPTLALTRGAKVARSVINLGVVNEDASEDELVALGRRAVGNATLNLGRGRNAASTASAGVASIASVVSSAAAAVITPVVSAADLVSPQGWGSTFSNQYTTMSVVNHAVKGASTRAVVRDLWTNIISSVKAGDSVVIQLGHKESGMPGSAQDIRAGCVASVPGLGSETMTITGCDGQKEVVQTYGTYLNQMCASVKAKGATCIVSSVIPKNEWKRGDSLTYNSPYIGYAKSAAAAAGAIYVPHEEVAANKMNADGPTTSTSYFLSGSTLQPNAAGADTFAQTFAAAAYCAGASGLTSSFTAAGQALKGKYC